VDRPQRIGSAAAALSVAGGFDAQYYLFHNPDVAGVDPLVHYNVHGWHEGRTPNAVFDTAGYLAHLRRLQRPPLTR
jgi:hypothetical protein